jgi:hypothetical protein
MCYLLKVDALVAAFVLSVAGLMILALFVWQKAKAYVLDLLRLYVDVWRPYLQNVSLSRSRKESPAQ